MPNGVIWGGAADGSNQVGAMVTCQAITASPAGVWAAAGTLETQARAIATSRDSRRGDGVRDECRCRAMEISSVDIERIDPPGGVRVSLGCGENRLKAPARQAADAPRTDESGSLDDVGGRDRMLAE